MRTGVDAPCPGLVPLPHNDDNNNNNNNNNNTKTRGQVLEEKGQRPAVDFPVARHPDSPVCGARRQPGRQFHRPADGRAQDPHELPNDDLFARMPRLVRCLCVGACVRACVCGCVRACVRVWVRACVRVLHFVCCAVGCQRTTAHQTLLVPDLARILECSGLCRYQDSGAEVVGVGMFSRLNRSVGVAGLIGIDRILSFQIVRNLQNLTRWVGRRTLCRDRHARTHICRHIRTLTYMKRGGLSRFFGRCRRRNLL